MSIGKSDSQRVGYGETIEADKSSSDIGEILGKQPPKGSAIDEVRDMFFPYWKSVLSRRLQLKIVPFCQLSRKDLLSAEASTKGTKSMDHPCNPIKSMEILVRWAGPHCQVSPEGCFMGCCFNVPEGV
ncbi:uncharacterized protein LOC127757324 [Oryza glaberrima]|uniref:uncharacterized protein LOC127757324 n=1 Tax=Oryza glaberrima TaxID=4538 RepID=UPI00224C27CF|nr:uncharacterized protein LOC127757324 [Oryza glaberrima]